MPNSQIRSALVIATDSTETAPSGTLTSIITDINIQQTNLEALLTAVNAERELLRTIENPPDYGQGARKTCEAFNIAHRQTLFDVQTALTAVIQKAETLQDRSEDDDTLLMLLRRRATRKEEEIVEDLEETLRLVESSMEAHYPGRWEDSAEA